MVKKFEKNIDIKVVQDFGHEWNTFTQSNIFGKEQKIIFDKYFRIFPWNIINKNSVGFDLGCGSGRWAKIISKKVGYLHCIDPSDSIVIAKKNTFALSVVFCRCQSILDRFLSVFFYFLSIVVVFLMIC